MASGLTNHQFDVEFASPYFFVDSDGDVFVIKESVFSSNYKEYVTGPLKGKTSDISDVTTEEYRKQTEELYGKYTPGGFFSDPTFNPGTLRKTLPIMDGTQQTGYIDEDGVYKFDVSRERGS